MAEKSFMTVEEVAAELRVSKSKAYQIVRELNAELQKQGYLTVAGRVNATFFIKGLLQRLSGKEMI
ncbi:MAG: DNA-binding protein [Dorea sp.]